MEKKIIKYFENRDLICLDDPNRKHYEGVTFIYIWKYVIEKRISKKRLASILLKLFATNKLFAIYCYNVNAVVFVNKSRHNGEKFTYSIEKVLDNEKYNKNTLQYVDTHIRNIKVAIMMRFLINSYKKYNNEILKPNKELQPV